MINIKIQKKDLWLLAAIMVFLIGVAYVIAYNSGASPSVIGHSAEEIEGVCLSDGTNCPNLGGFGVWNDRNKDGVADSVNFGTNYYAETNGFAMAQVWASGGWPDLFGYTDNKPVPTTLKLQCDVTDTGGYACSITMPVRKGDYWRIENVDTRVASRGINWIPLGN